MCFAFHILSLDCWAWKGKISLKSLNESISRLWVGSGVCTAHTLPAAILPVPPYKGLPHQHSEHIGCLSVFYSSCHGHCVSDSPYSSVAILVYVCVSDMERERSWRVKRERKTNPFVWPFTALHNQCHTTTTSAQSFCRTAPIHRAPIICSFTLETEPLVWMCYLHPLSLSLGWFHWCAFLLLMCYFFSSGCWTDLYRGDTFVWVESRAARSRGREHISQPLWDVFPLCCTLLKMLQTVHPHFLNPIAANVLFILVLNLYGEDDLPYRRVQIQL